MEVVRKKIENTRKEYTRKESEFWDGSDPVNNLSVERM